MDLVSAIQSWRIGSCSRAQAIYHLKQERPLLSYKLFACPQEDAGYITLTFWHDAEGQQSSLIMLESRLYGSTPKGPFQTLFSELTSCDCQGTIEPQSLKNAKPGTHPSVHSRASDIAGLIKIETDREQQNLHTIRHQGRETKPG